MATGIMNNFDGSEDNYFTFPTHISDYIDDDMDNEQFNQMDNSDFIPDNINNNKYTLKNVRDQVFLKNKDIIYGLGFRNMESDSLKNYYYYSSFSFI